MKQNPGFLHIINYETQSCLFTPLIMRQKPVFAHTINYEMETCVCSQQEWEKQKGWGWVGGAHKKGGEDGGGRKNPLGWRGRRVDVEGDEGVWCIREWQDLQEGHTPCAMYSSVTSAVEWMARRRQPHLARHCEPVIHKTVPMGNYQCVREQNRHQVWLTHHNNKNMPSCQKAFGNKSNPRTERKQNKQKTMISAMTLVHLLHPKNKMKKNKKKWKKTNKKPLRYMTKCPSPQVFTTKNMGKV